jgi:hypothetical protein
MVIHASGVDGQVGSVSAGKQRKLGAWELETQRVLVTTCWLQTLARGICFMGTVV